MNSASYKFIQNAATIQPFDMVKKTELRHDASGSWGRHGFEIELLLPQCLAATKNEQRSRGTAHPSAKQFITDLYTGQSAWQARSGDETAKDADHD